MYQDTGHSNSYAKIDIERKIDREKKQEREKVKAKEREMKNKKIEIVWERGREKERKMWIKKCQLLKTIN